MQYQRRTQQQHFFMESVQTDKFLINTSKAVKGHKLKTKDFVQMQLLRFRKCSPVKYQEIYTTDNANTSQSKGFSFKKFKPFESVDQEGLHKIVQNQRIKLSRENRGRIKMFNNTKINSMVQSNYQPDQTFNPIHKPRTGHQFRQLKKNITNKTVANDSLVHEEMKKQKKKHTVFRSQNLGTKMNEYLNLYLNSQGKQEDEEQSPRKKEEKEDKDKIMIEERQNNTIDVFRKKPNAFHRRMKKIIKSRVDTSDYDLQVQQKSEQLAKPQTSFSKRQPNLSHSKDS